MSKHKGKFNTLSSEDIKTSNQNYGTGKSVKSQLTAVLTGEGRGLHHNILFVCIQLHYDNIELLTGS